MDRITQLQDGVEQFLFLTSMNYMQEHASLLPTSPGIPVTQKNEAADSDEVVKAAKQELAKNIVQQVKQNEILIDSLSTLTLIETDQLSEIDQSYLDNETAREELMNSITNAEKLVQLLDATLHHIKLDLLADPF